MRKIVLSFFAVLVFVSAFAQERGWEYQLGVTLGAYDRAGFTRCSEIIDVQSSSSVNGVQHSANPIVLPTFSFETGYNMADVHLGFFLGVYWNYAWDEKNGGPSPLVEKEHILHIMPQLRFYYLFEPKIRLYATMGAGLRYRQFSETFEGDKISNSGSSISYQVSPFGMAFGDRWAVSCDLGYGTAWSIMKIAARYSF